MKYENIGLCTIRKGYKSEHGAFNFKKDAETMTRLIKGLCEEVEELKNENKNLSIKIESLLLLGGIISKK